VRERMAGLAVSDPSPIVRLALASAVGRLSHDDRWPILRGLVSRGEDANDRNLPLLYWYALEPLIPQAMDRTFELALRGEVPLLLRYTTRRIAEIGSPEAFALLVDRLGKLDAIDGRITVLKAVNSALRGRRRAPMPTGWPTTFAALRNCNDKTVR